MQISFFGNRIPQINRKPEYLSLSFITKGATCRVMTRRSIEGFAAGTGAVVAVWPQAMEEPKTRAAKKVVNFENMKSPCKQQLKIAPAGLFPQSK